MEKKEKTKKTIQAEKYTYPKCWDIYYALIPEREGNQGSIYKGKRPVLIASNDKNNRYSTIVNVYPFTSHINKRNLPVHVNISGFGLERESTLACEQWITLEKSDLIYKVGHIDDYITRLKIQQAAQLQSPIFSTIL